MTEITLRKATDEDRKILFEWANDPEVRKASFETHEITWEEHCAWYERIMTEGNVLQYILEEEGKPSGQIRFAVKEGNAEISYSIAPESRGRGLAACMISMGIRKARSEKRDISEFTARVKPDNVISAKVFRNLGFDENPEGVFTFFPGR